MAKQPAAKLVEQLKTKMKEIESWRPCDLSYSSPAWGCSRDLGC